MLSLSNDDYNQHEEVHTAEWLLMRIDAKGPRSER